MGCVRGRPRVVGSACSSTIQIYNIDYLGEAGCRMVKSDGFVELIGRALEGDLTDGDVREIAGMPREWWTVVCGIAGRIKFSSLSNSVRLCAVVNARSGLCDQDCAFCAQAFADRTQAPVYPLISHERLMEFARDAEANGATAFCIVTSGKKVSGKDFERILEMVESLKGRFLSVCASLGCLERPQLEELKAAGLVRYHHNLETGPNFYPRICTTRPYDQNFETLEFAKEAGLEVCAGGIFGMGESWDDRIDMLLELKRAEIDSLPVNFLIPIEGTPLESEPSVEPLEGLFCLALARLVHRDIHIVVCGGREARLKELQAAALVSGASGIMVGNYLTQPGRPAELDLEMLEDLGMVPEKEEGTARLRAPSRPFTNMKLSN